MKIKIGVMGCANIAEKCMIPAIKAINDFELVAVASRTKEKAEVFADKFSCDAVVNYANLIDREDINAVYIPLPTGLHEEWIIKSLKKGKHVIAEKSLAVDYASTARIIKEAEERQLLVMENYMFQYHNQHSFVQNLIKDGEIGEIHFFRSSFGFPPRATDDIRYSKKLGGGALLDAGGYVVKAAQQFLGPHLELRGAFLKYHRKLGIDIFGSALFMNNKDQIAQLSFSFDNFYQCNYEIWGSKGKVTADRAFTPPPDFAPKIILEKQNHKQEFVITPDNHFINILNELNRAIQEKDYYRHWNDALLQASLLEKIREKHARE